MKYSDFNFENDFCYFNILEVIEHDVKRYDPFCLHCEDVSEFRKYSIRYNALESVKNICEFSDLKIIPIAIYNNDYINKISNFKSFSDYASQMILRQQVLNGAAHLLEFCSLFGYVNKNDKFIITLADKLDNLYEFLPELNDCPIFWSNVPQFYEASIMPHKEDFRVVKQKNSNMGLKFAYINDFDELSDDVKQVIECAKNQEICWSIANDMCRGFIFNDYTINEYLNDVVAGFTFGHEKRKFFHYIPDNVSHKEIDIVRRLELFNEEDKKELEYNNRIVEGVKAIWRDTLKGTGFENIDLNATPDNKKALAAMIAMGRELGVEPLIAALYAGVPISDLIEN